ncbi:flagellar motor switch phosphatase FliY [Desertibacillus haloalkaliphilus]|nr:flagellar motor switch phosphatase FliY [Desertibacillus haloalkaliphilus]
MLSQEEINELLKGVGNDDGSNNDENVADQKQQSTGDIQELNVEDFLSVIEQDALGEIGNISFGSAATALSTLLNQKVDITTPQVSVIRQDLLEDEFPQPHVAVRVQYTEGFEGTNLLVIKNSDAAIIADLMMGGDGSNPNEDLGEMEISAVQEAMNQMMGSASTSMSTIFNKRVDISPPGIDLMNLPKEEGTSYIPEDDVLIKSSFRLKIGDLIDSNIMQLVTVPFAKQLVEELMNPTQEEVAPPVDEPSANEEVPIQEQTPNPGQQMGQQPPMPEQQPMAQQAMSQQQMATPMQAQPQGFQQQMGQQGHHQHFGSPSYQAQNQRTANVQPAAFSNFDAPELTQAESNNLNMLLDIPLQVTVELGRTKRSIKEILEFSQGSIIELDKLAGEPVDILVNQKLIAKGEVVVIDENFGVRVTDIVSQEERIKNLK